MLQRTRAVSRTELSTGQVETNLDEPDTTVTTTQPWITVYTEAPGTLMSESDDENPIKLLYFPEAQAYVEGKTYEVRLSWQSDWIQFTVPAGSNIFQQSRPGGPIGVKK
jgi:hypothetical protein